MTDRAAALLLFAILCGVVPIAVVLIVAVLRSYTVDLHMTREERRRRHGHDDAP